MVGAGGFLCPGQGIADQPKASPLAKRIARPSPQGPPAPKVQYFLGWVLHSIYGRQSLFLKPSIYGMVKIVGLPPKKSWRSPTKINGLSLDDHFPHRRWHLHIYLNKGNSLVEFGQTHLPWMQGFHTIWGCSEVTNPSAAFGSGLLSLHAVVAP